jgi:hypothetical protein
VSPPIARPIPRFIADSSQEGLPYGRWAERVRQEFARRCEKLADEAGARLEPESVFFFPERGWGGRVYLPLTGRPPEDSGSPVEFFGYVSFRRAGDEEPTDLRAGADFTDVTADDHPEWQIDINEDVIGDWRADAGRGGDVTLVWGIPLVRGAVAATAELGPDVVDQTPIHQGRFTLIAVDAVKGFGDDLYLELRLWDRRLNELASESLYADSEEEEPEAEPESESGDEKRE